MAALKFTCAHCAQPLEAPEEAAGLALDCPSCQTPIQVPMNSTRAPGAPANPATGKVCAICLSPIAVSEAKQECPACHAEFHAECWQENGGCAIYGCAQVPQIEQRHAIEIPVSYWGQENKPCPSCGREILAAAVRCRHCGATFESARPQDSEEFQRRSAQEQRLPALRRTVIWLFVFCVLPCLAPIGAVWGAVWYPQHREEVKALPSLYGALCKIGLGVAIGQSVLVMLMAFLFTAARHR